VVPVIAVLVLAQKFVPRKAAFDVPLATIGLGVLIGIAPLNNYRPDATDGRYHRCASRTDQ
jgi:hypothetical protein